MSRPIPEHEVIDAYLVDLTNIRITNIRVYDPLPLSSTLSISRPYKHTELGSASFEIRWLDFRKVPRKRPTLQICTTLPAARAVLVEHLQAVRKKLNQRVEKVDKLLTEIPELQPLNY
jgi:hypothetical protein